jgi:hypothetical protein
MENPPSLGAEPPSNVSVRDLVTLLRAGEPIPVEVQESLRLIRSALPDSPSGMPSAPPARQPSLSACEPDLPAVSVSLDSRGLEVREVVEPDGSVSRHEVVDVFILAPERPPKRPKRGYVPGDPTISDVTIIPPREGSDRTILAAYPNQPLVYTVSEQDAQHKKRIQSKRDAEVVRVKKHLLKSFVSQRDVARRQAAAMPRQPRVAPDAADGMGHMRYPPNSSAWPSHKPWPPFASTTLLVPPFAGADLTSQSSRSNERSSTGSRSGTRRAESLTSGGHSIPTVQTRVVGGFLPPTMGSGVPTHQPVPVAHDGSGQWAFRDHIKPVGSYMLSSRSMVGNSLPDAKGGETPLFGVYPDSRYLARLARVEDSNSARGDPSMLFTGDEGSRAAHWASMSDPPMAGQYPEIGILSSSCDRPGVPPVSFSGRVVGPHTLPPPSASSSSGSQRAHNNFKQILTDEAREEATVTASASQRGAPDTSNPEPATESSDFGRWNSSVSSNPPPVRCNISDYISKWRPPSDVTDEQDLLLRRFVFSSEHVSCPYPNWEDLEELQRRTGMTSRTIERWFAKARPQLWAPVVKSIIASCTDNGRDSGPQSAPSHSSSDLTERSIKAQPHDFAETIRSSHQVLVDPLVGKMMEGVLNVERSNHAHRSSEKRSGSDNSPADGNNTGSNPEPSVEGLVGSVETSKHGSSQSRSLTSHSGSDEQASIETNHDGSSPSETQDGDQGDASPAQRPDEERTTPQRTEGPPRPPTGSVSSDTVAERSEKELQSDGVARRGLGPDQYQGLIREYASAVARSMGSSVYSWSGTDRVSSDGGQCVQGETTARTCVPLGASAAAMHAAAMHAAAISSEPHGTGGKRPSKRTRGGEDAGNPVEEAEGSQKRFKRSQQLD